MLSKMAPSGRASAVGCKESAHALGSAATLLDSIASKLDSRERAMLEQVRQTMQTCAGTLDARSGVGVEGGISTTNYMAKRAANAERRRSLEPGASMLPQREGRKPARALQDITMFNANQSSKSGERGTKKKHRGKRGTAGSAKCSGKRARKENSTGKRKRKENSAADVDYDRKYSSADVVELLVGLKKDGVPLLATVDKLIERECVPCTRAALYKLLQKALRGHKVRPFGAIGREHAASDDELLEIKERRAGSDGSTLSFDQFCEELDTLAKKKRAKKGLSNVGYRGVNQKTARHSYEYLKSITDVVMCKPVSKTGQRWTSEHSIRAALTFALTTLAAHHIPGPVAAGQITHAVDEIMGTPGVWVNPSLLFSTDDMTMVIGLNPESKHNEYVIADRRYRAKRGDKTRAYFNTDEKLRQFQNVMRVQLTFTMSAGGHMAAPYVTVKLSARELPESRTPSGMLFCPISGFTAGGATDLRNDAEGYLVFVREKGADDPTNYEAPRFKHYR